MGPPIDLDTIKYPSLKPKVILSVSDAPYSELVHLDASQYLYVERYSLARYLSAEAPPGRHGHTRFHLFTHQLDLQDSETLGFGRTGGPGTAENPNAGSGGEIVLSVEDAMIDQKKLEKFRINVSGGAGFNPTSVPGKEIGDNGGNGGDGGHAFVWLGEDGQEPKKPVGKMLEWVNKTHKIIKGNKDWKWPVDFKVNAKFMDDLNSLVTLSKDKTVVEVYKLAWKSTDDAMAMSLDDFKTTLTEMHFFFKPKKVTTDADDRLRLLEKGVIWRRGSYGTGGLGHSEQGKNGKDGNDGTVLAKWLAVSEMQKQKVCFAHPAQCQMLLDKANVLYFLGTSRSIAKSKKILQTLEKRLLFLGGAQDSIDGTKLADAYKSAEKRLFIQKTPDPISNSTDPEWKKNQNDEPAAVRQIRAIRDEASRISRQIDSGFDFYGPDGDTIPNLSFETYKDILKEFIDHATKANSAYSDYQTAETDMDKRHAALSSAADATVKRRTANDYYYRSSRAVIEENAAKIDILVNLLKDARRGLEEEVDSVQKLIKDAFSVSFKDAVGAISQVLFMAPKAAPLMAELQAMDLYEDASTKIENDLGDKLKKSYVIKRVKKITASALKGLFEEFSTSADGKVTVKDGNDTKLAMAEDELDTLIDSISEKLKGGDKAVVATKAKFEKYISLIKERNNAVLQYNSALNLMRKCEKDRATIDAANEVIANQLQDLGSENPQLVLFMRRLYTDSLTDTQLMVNRAQKALNFEFLGNFNAFERLSDYSSSHSSVKMLGAAQEQLCKEHVRLKEEHRPRQAFKGIKYPLDDLDLVGLTPSSEGNIKFMKKIARKSGDPFEGKADVRLTKACFFVKGSTTDSKQLNITLTHDTTETIYDEKGGAHRFSHPKQIVAFSHHTETLAVGDSDGTIGEAKEMDGYMLIGPFTSWWVDIRASNNKGLRGDNIKEAWFEFDGEARAVVPS